MDYNITYYRNAYGAYELTPLGQLMVDIAKQIFLIKQSEFEKYLNYST